MSVLMTYGGYTLEPAPQMTLSMRHIRDDAGNLIDILHTANLQGKLLSLGTSTPGPAMLLSLQDDMRVAMSSCSGCKLFEFSCDGTTLISAYARVNSLTFSPSSDNWVFTSNYEMELEWNAISDVMLASGIVAAGGNTSCLHCLSTTSETWDVSIPENPARYLMVGCTGVTKNRDVIQIAHSISAKGYNCCVSGVFHNGWERAKQWVTERIGYNSQILTDVSGVFSFEPADFTTYNHSRVVNVNRGGGEFSVQEQWTLIGSSGIPLCLEEFTVSVDTDNSTRYTNVSVQGTITGLESRNSNFVITKTKIEAADECWLQVKDSLYTRANCMSNTTCPLRVSPTRTSVLRNPTGGVITYNYTYDTKPQLIANSRSEQVNISDALPSEQIATIPVLGRAAGPILYPLKSANSLEKRASISILMAEPTGCYDGATAAQKLCSLYLQPPSSGVEDLLCCIEGTMSSYRYYRTSDQQSWAPLDGQYQRDVVWLLTPTSCSGGLPTSFC